jgi:hypothetical protein
MPQVYLQIWARVDWAGGGAWRQSRACSETRGIVQRFRDGQQALYHCGGALLAQHVQERAACYAAGLCWRSPA